MGILNVQRKNKYRPIRHGILIEQMQDLLRKNRYTQVPQLSSGKYIELSEFYCIN